MAGSFKQSALDADVHPGDVVMRLNTSVVAHLNTSVVAHLNTIVMVTMQAL